jgi:hypothetical protein
VTNPCGTDTLAVVVTVATPVTYSYVYLPLVLKGFSR